MVPAAQNLQMIYHEIDLHSLDGGAHPFSPVKYTLPGTVDKKDIHIAPGLTKTVSLLSYESDDFFTWITPTRVDYELGQAAFGTCPVEYGGASGDVTYRLHQAPIAQIVRKPFDPTIQWVSLRDSLAQTIVTPPTGAHTLDMSAIDDKPVDMLLPLDLNETTHDFALQGKDRTIYNLARIATLGSMENAIVTSGEIIAAPGNGTIETRESGILDASKPGNHVLIGGIGKNGDNTSTIFVDSTIFVGGPGHKTFVIRAAPSDYTVFDSIAGYKPREDKIVIPRDTPSLIGAAFKGTSETDTIWVLDFIDTTGNIYKELVVSGNIKSPDDLTIESPDGTKIHVKEIPATMMPKPRLPIPQRMKASLNNQPVVR